ncbi:lipopolysaccharide biosynthesis protein [Methylobacterium oryzihabitans]|uniref:Polysaccharide biosynthesis protein n=1 Tax=Methylobacterium oryzihabitans TaxID=2499852 RepID=A0A3S2VN19_9HYPH|nr:hypothetical protein [Methylobacterium oryzihabitans]RVU16580.1 hypothetical protein EOE48_15990 [Methylobacterium oryzihabitans]
MRQIRSLLRNPRVLSFLDQVSFSLGNFVVLMAFARGFTAVEFAGYGIGFAVVILLQSVYRVAFVVPMALVPDAAFEADRKAYAGQHLLIVGGLIALAAVAWGATLVLPVPPLAVASAVAAFSLLSSFLPQDFERTFLLRTGHQLQALLASLTFLALTLVSAGLVALHAAPFTGVMLLFWLFGVVRTALAVRRAPRPDLAGGRALLASAVRAGSASWNMLGTVASAGFSHVPLFILSFFAPAINVAAYTAVRAPMQPLQIVVRSLDLVDKVVFGRIDADDRVARHRHLRRTYVLYLAVGLVGATLIGTFAGPLIGLMFGAKYAGFEGTMRLWGAMFVIISSSLPLETAILSAGHYRGYALMQCAGGALAIVLAFPLSHLFYDFGAVLACLIGWSLTYAMLAIRVYLIIARNEDRDHPIG